MFSQIDKQIVRAWHQYLLEPRLAKLTGRVLRRTGPRIAVVGNCQSYGVAYAMKLLDPLATVDHYSAIGRSRADIGLFARTIETYDYVFSHEFPPGHVRNGDSEELRRRVPKTILFPPVTFSAFHPDLVYLLDETRNYAALFGPLGPYHSALAVFAYRKGLTLEEANALYNGNVFEVVGYFDVWNDAAKEFLDNANQKYGMDLSTELLNWSRRGVFMYSTVHPKSFVLHDIARQLFAKAGLKGREIDYEYYAIHDLARSEIFPIYPAIADRFGVPGGYLFKMQNHHLSAGTGDFLNLPQYLSACYKIFQGCENTQMSHPRIEKWLADDVTGEYLVELAKDNLRAGKTPTL